MGIQARKQTEYSLIDFLLETELGYMKNYINDQSKLLKIHEENVKTMIDKEIIWIDDKPLFPFGLDTMINSSFFTNNIFYKSTFITLYSFLESLLKEISRIERKKMKLTIAPKDLRGQGVLLYKDYLVKVIQIDFKQLNSLWSQIDDARIVRNYLVHDYLDYADRSETKDMERISKSNPSLSFNPHDKTLAIIENKYLLDFCTLINLFTNALLNLLRDRDN